MVNRAKVTELLQGLFVIVLVLLLVLDVPDYDYNYEQERLPPRLHPGRRC
jgi:hypothetical protein